MLSYDERVARARATIAAAKAGTLGAGRSREKRHPWASSPETSDSASDDDEPRNSVAAGPISAQNSRIERVCASTSTATPASVSRAAQTAPPPRAQAAPRSAKRAPAARCRTPATAAPPRPSTASSSSSPDGPAAAPAFGRNAEPRRPPTAGGVGPPRSASSSRRASPSPRQSPVLLSSHRVRVPTPVPRTSGGSAAGGVSRPRVPQLLPSPAPRVGRSLGGGGLGAEAAVALRIGARIALPELELTQQQLADALARVAELERAKAATEAAAAREREAAAREQEVAAEAAAAEAAFIERQESLLNATLRAAGESPPPPIPPPPAHKSSYRELREAAAARRAARSVC